MIDDSWVSSHKEISRNLNQNAHENTVCMQKSRPGAAMRGRRAVCSEACPWTSDQFLLGVAHEMLSAAPKRPVCTHHVPRGAVRATTPPFGSSLLLAHESEVELHRVRLPDALPACLGDVVDAHGASGVGIAVGRSKDGALGKVESIRRLQVPLVARVEHAERRW